MKITHNSSNRYKKYKNSSGVQKDYTKFYFPLRYFYTHKNKQKTGNIATADVHYHPQIFLTTIYSK